MIGPALLDANVLFPQLLRDVMISLAAERAFSACWTTQIHDEWTRNVLQQRPDIAPASLETVRRLMNDNVPDCLIEGFEALIPSLALPDPDDRHVLAAAIHGRSRFIVTRNLKDFPPHTLAPHGIRALAPDSFLCLVWSDEPKMVLSALARQRQRFQKPPLSPDVFLEALKRQELPRFVAALEPFQNQL